MYGKNQRHNEQIRIIRMVGVDDLPSVFGIVAGALQGGFFGVCGIIGCTLSAIIFGWQSWG